MKICLALFLKNENPNILSWISWHLAIGIDKFFIYDDHSTDGTYEILKTVSNIYNIEIELTNPVSIPYFYDRQANAFESACRKALNQEYDWIGFLDADEYVSLEHDLSIQDFFKKFLHYNGISLNWRIYGNSDRVLKSKIPTYEAYTKHCDKNFSDTLLTKCFIRPRNYSFEYENPHYFKTIPQNYANACGLPVSNKRADSDTVIWDNACINHYINRSMEDYIIRIQYRLNTDLINSEGRWKHFNRNDIQHEERKDFIKKANEILVTLKQECVYRYIFEITGSFNKKKSNNKQSNCFKLCSTKERYLALHMREGYLFNFENIQNMIPIYGVIYNHKPNLIYLFYKESNSISTIPFIIKFLNKFSSTYQFSVCSIDNTPYHSLQTPYSKKFMSLNPDTGFFGDVDVNKNICKEWEYLQLKSKDLEINFNVSPDSVHDLYSFYNYLYQNSEDITYADFILAYNLLSKKEQSKIHIHNVGKIISWL